MELIHTIECKTHVSASLKEAGEFGIKAFAEAEYAPGRTTTVEVALHELPTTVQTRVREALHDALSAAHALLGLRIGQAIHKSAEVAARFGEI